jgi:cyclic beta-1,2-glucan synthetase
MPIATPPALEPIRAEIFGVERLEQHAETLARAQRVDPRKRRGAPVLARFEENARVLRQAYGALAEAAQKDQAISPAAEWLIDNYYIIDEQIREIRETLPASYYRELPKLVEGHLADHPRVYGIAWAFVAHTDSRFDPDLLERFVRAYQREAPLTMGELWAIPASLRLILIENLRRLAEQIVHAREARARAGELADLLLSAGNLSSDDVLLALRPYELAPLDRPFVVELVQRMRESDPAASPVLDWLEGHLADQAVTPEALVREEHTTQLAAHATVANIVTSMRQLSSFEWSDFFESVSLVESILRRDPAGIYPRMDFKTRDAYRHVIEELARGTEFSEQDLAQELVARAARAQREIGEGTDVDPREVYLGFYLLDEGRRTFEKQLGYRPPLSHFIRRAYVALATPGYLGTIAVASALLLALLLVYVALVSGSWTAVFVLGILALIPATDLAIAVVQRDVTELLPPRRLPKLDLEDGVPPEYRTLVVVPTMLTSEADVHESVEGIERHYLANSEGHLGFAILSDWRDASEEHLADDEQLLALAANDIAELNQRYGEAPWGGTRFLLFHRRRVWNEREGKWMGWERKRGKIRELNRLLRGATDTTFVLRADGLTDAPPDVQYVITLDADTRLTPGAAHRLVGTLAHPLNRAGLDPREQRVAVGYGIVQPRVTPMLPRAGERTLYHRIFAGPTGIDPYSAAASDVYQDLFGHGIYVGKGIYDVDAFETALADRVPENTLLSHDLFEGIWARCGLATDIELFDEFPTHYETSARRIHRWARGDWQLLPWVLGVPPAVDGRRPPSAMPVIDRWMMIDNLRRTLSSPSTFLLLLVGWMVLPVSPLLWTGFVVVTLAMPAAVSVLAGLVPRHHGIAKRTHIRGVLADALEAAVRVGLAVVFLANRAVLMTDSIVRTLWRLLVTRKKLLEWTPAALAGRGAARDLGSAYRSMWRPVALTAAAAAILTFVRPEALHLTLPILLLWAASPAFALWLSRPIVERPGETLRPSEAHLFRRIARRTWRYFELFVGKGTHGLPPDNLQEDPEAVIARRTSPTNIGAYLLSIAAARDFAWIGTVESVERVEATFATLDRLDRFHGHFYNWYDIDRLVPLEPRYVSTVDSGNLAGHLLTISQTCREWIGRPVLGPAVLAGLGDAAAIVAEARAGISPTLRGGAVSRHDLDDAYERLRAGLATTPAGALEWAARLEALSEAVDDLLDVAAVLRAETSDASTAELAAWAEALRDGIQSHARDLDVLAPWARLLRDAPPPELETDPALAPHWKALGDALAFVAAPGVVPPTVEEARAALGAMRGGVEGREGVAWESVRRWLRRLAEAIEAGVSAARVLHDRLEALAGRGEAYVMEMDFAFLYDPTRKLFPIGYRISDGRYDTGYYDLLASEARLASLIAIAKGDVPVEHWFRLGRPLTPVGGGSALLSWSGSMFEYLMPFLVMEAAPGTMLDRTHRLVVERQIRYGRERGVPWGVSEAAYNARDLELTYQYSHFGVPGLGLTRGLSEDLVVAPYATALAAMVLPRAAARNFERLAAEGALGLMGFYEALDYTPERVPAERQAAVVRAYMAHHHGMTIAALANVLLDGVLRRRFHAVPMIGAADLLLQERVPRDVPVARPRVEEVRAVRHVREIVPPVVRRFTSPHHRMPRTHILSNGRYSVMVTNAGSGYSRWRDLAVTRWREDTTRDPWGTFVFLRDVSTGAVWSAGYQPTAVQPSDYEIVFSEDRVEIRRRDDAIATTLEIVVSPEDDAELRRVTIKNLGARSREIEVTTYAEVVIAPAELEAAHPAFHNLFVQTEFVSPFGAVLATRRPRSDDENTVWAGHVGAVEGQAVGAIQYETDRARFLDRGRGVRTPSSVVEGRPLSNTTGAVLDPIFALRRTVRLRPGESARVTFSTFVADSREGAIALADKYHDPAAYDRAAGLAWTQAHVLLQHLGISRDEAHLFQRLASRILYADPSLRPPSSIIMGTERGQEALWRYGISGDLPIVLVRIDQMRDREIVRQLLRAHEYWGWKGLAVDLVVLNEHEFSYSDELQDWLERIARVIQARAHHEVHERHGEVRILRADRLPPEERDVMRSAARAILLSHHGSLAEQLDTAVREETFVAAPPRIPSAPGEPEVPPPRPRVSFFNGLGGFAEGGREYVTILGEGQWTPAPWINVVANSDFGFIVSEAGSGYTWALNSRENRLTPWSNDPVSDPPGEVLYVRDEETGAVWTPTPLPMREPSPYVVRHGQGYSRFEHQSHDLALELTQYVPLHDPIKISRLVIRNPGSRTRRLSVTAYAEWALGIFREKSAPFLGTELDRRTGALFATNRWNGEYAARVAFADLRGRQTSWTADRTEFLGRNGGPRFPAGMQPGRTLGGTAGGGFDPCAALRQPVTVAPGGEVEVVFLLGQGADAEEARVLVERYRAADLDEVLEEVTTFWGDVLTALQVRTPDYSMSIMLNRWLLYQALSCRVWGRSAFYQSGGAYGFRDQLQDVMALVVARREIAREHLLRAASRQFVEGDVQHWWHPPSGRGVRTRITDDRLWLPYAVVHYLDVTGEEELLDVEVPFLGGEPLAEDEHERYFEPEENVDRGSLYEHCARAIDVSLAFGTHGLPLMGDGDWNDGMNRVGHEGRGESVWLGWFLHMAIASMLPYAEKRGEADRIERWRAHLSALDQALEEAGWDGDWYRRAYFDDGTPLGSAANPECRIDSIAQSWGVLSGVARSDRAQHAMKAVEQHLVKRGDGLVLLFTPPFDKWDVDPGYIKGYLPGVRENGGQYTHAAIWSVIAFAELGDGDKAAELFSILNPINHASTRAGIYRYKVEPYISVADVYAEAPHAGRGGWTWYTGSAGWMYRAGIEWILGFRLRGETLFVDPCIPRDWPGFDITFRYHSARYEVAVENPAGVMRGVQLVEVDGVEVPECGWAEAAVEVVGNPGSNPGYGKESRREGRGRGARVPLQDDDRLHRIHIILG